jgi:hypothetical protein
MAITKIKSGENPPTISDLEDKQLGYSKNNRSLYIRDLDEIVGLTGYAAGGENFLKIVTASKGTPSSAPGTTEYNHWIMSSWTDVNPLISVTHNTDYSKLSNEILMLSTDSVTNQLSPVFVIKWTPYGWQARCITFFAYRNAAGTEVLMACYPPPGAPNITNCAELSWPLIQESQRASRVISSNSGTLAFGTDDNGSKNLQCRYLNFVN